MPVLKNPKHEIFVQHIIAGTSAAGAYKLSGFKGKDPRKRASDLRTKPEIKARVEELAGRITNNAVKRTTTKLAIDKERFHSIIIDSHLGLMIHRQWFPKGSEIVLE